MAAPWPNFEAARVEAVEAYLLEQRASDKEISWRAVLNNHASTRPKEYGGALVRAVTTCKEFAASGAGWRCTLTLPSSFAPGDGRRLVAIGESETKNEASELACLRAVASLVIKNPGQVVLRPVHWKVTPDVLVANLPGVAADPASGGHALPVRTPARLQGAGSEEPMGAVKVGLIYVNPEGPLNDPNDLNSGQNPDPEKSAVEIREVFGRMGMNDSETASLIAGGHAFGKCHGAGVMTSGFEGPWTTTPSQWTNQFLTGMLDEEWEQVATPSGSAVQWQTKDRASILAGTMRLTADLALVNDDAYLALAKHWVCDQQKLDIAFAASWKKLVESGGGWLPVEDRSAAISALPLALRLHSEELEAMRPEFRRQWAGSDVSSQRSDIFGVTDSWQDTDCVVQGNCQEPMGAVKVGLIYVNPEGPLNDPNDLNSGQNPDPEKSAVEIREVFGRMGMNDSETATLIAGGHAFGKCHGAGVMTSGFEGPWTTTPSQWTNQFLTGMLDEEWEQVATPSGSAVQWQTKDRTSILAGTMRLTADLALVSDDAYMALAKHWVCDQQKLDIAFAASWKKLVESGGGWLPVED
ncbi:unnamed protein product, partial [Prorocentrum cordatum]